MTKIPRQLAKNKITSLNLKNKKKTKDDLNAENYLRIVKEKIGFVPNVLAAFSNFPKQFEGFTKLYNSIMLGDSGLTKLEREMIAVTVSSLNHCYYCIVAHGSAKRIIWRSSIRRKINFKLRSNKFSKKTPSNA